MRIAFVYDALYPWVKGGGERRFHELGRRLAEDHDVHFVSWRWWDGPSVMKQDGVTLHGVGRPPEFYGEDGRRTVREALSFSLRLLPVLARNRWDVIDCSATPYLPVYTTWLASRLTRTPLVVTWHEFWGELWHEYLPNRPVVARLARRLEARALRLNDRVVAVSDFTARRMGISAGDRLRVVGNGVTLLPDTAVAVPGDGKSIAARMARMGNSAGVTEVVYVGRLIAEKRVDLLIDAMAVLALRFPELRCGIFGQGPLLEELRARADRLGVADRIEFRQGADEAEIHARLTRAKLLVLPSVREGFGMTVAEAQACGTVPVVVRSPTSAASELVRHGIDGVLVDPSPLSLADGIAWVLRDRQRLLAMSEQAGRVGRSREWRSIVTRMEEVYAG